MKRAGDLYERIPAYENLCLAFWKAARGKQDRREVIAFRRDFDDNIQSLRDQLRRHDPVVGRYRFFRINDPKPRDICAAAFPERVLHHAVMNVCEPVLESCAIHDSYACRRGKGNRRALLRAQAFARRWEWYLKLDIRRYFDSIDHAVMMDLLARRFKDGDLLDLFRKLLNTYHIRPGKGMPIGNLISQHLANFYLGRLDHWVKEERRIRGYLRFMDDFILYGPEREFLKQELVLLREFLAENLALELKDDIQLNRCRRGIPFIGYRVFPGRIRLSPRSRRRFSRKFRQYEKHWHEGEWTTGELVRRMNALIAFTRMADAGGFRRHVLERYGVPS